MTKSKKKITNFEENMNIEEKILIEVFNQLENDRKKPRKQRLKEMIDRFPIK